METNSNLAELFVQLREFGFQRSAGLIYSFILLNGPARAERIMKECQFPDQETKEALDFLVNLRVIGLDRERRTKVYYAIEPNIAWLAVIADLVWSNRVDIGPIRKLSNTQNLDVERSRIICDRIMQLAQSLYTPHTAVTQHKEHDAMTSDELAQVICECIYRARNKILAVSKTPRHPQVSSFWAVLTDRLSQGVSYSRIIDLQEVIDHGLAIVRRDFETYKIDIKVLENHSITHKFYVVDNAYVAVFHTDDRLNGYPWAGRITTKKEIISRYSNRFKTLSKSAIPIWYVLNHMENAAQELVSQGKILLDSIEVAWLQDLISYGKFSKFHIQESWINDRYNKVLEKAINGNLVVLNQNGDPIPNYPTTEERLRSSFHSSNI